MSEPPQDGPQPEAGEERPPVWFADQAVLRVFIQEDPGSPKDEVWEVTAGSPQFDYQWLFEQVGQLPYAAGQHNPNIRKLTVSRTDWGADAASFEVLLTVGQWMAAQGAAAAFGYAFNELVQSIRHRSRTMDQRPLTRDEAIARARWKVAAAYSVDEATLVERSVEETADGWWTIELANSHDVYAVTFVVEDGCVVTTRMKVTRGDSGPA